jgi:hypothetical protein
VLCVSFVVVVVFWGLNLYFVTFSLYIVCEIQAQLALLVAMLTEIWLPGRHIDFNYEGILCVCSSCISPSCTGGLHHCLTPSHPVSFISRQNVGLFKIPFSLLNHRKKEKLPEMN